MNKQSLSLKLFIKLGFCISRPSTINQTSLQNHLKEVVINDQKSRLFLTGSVVGGAGPHEINSLHYLHIPVATSKNVDDVRGVFHGALYPFGVGKGDVFFGSLVVGQTHDCNGPSKIEWDLANGPLSKLLEL